MAAGSSDYEALIGADTPRVSRVVLKCTGFNSRVAPPHTGTNASGENFTAYILSRMAVVPGERAREIEARRPLVAQFFIAPEKVISIVGEGCTMTVTEQQASETPKISITSAGASPFTLSLPQDKASWVVTVSRDGGITAKPTASSIKITPSEYLKLLNHSLLNSWPLIMLVILSMLVGAFYGFLSAEVEYCESRTRALEERAAEVDCNSIKKWRRRESCPHIDIINCTKAVIAGITSAANAKAKAAYEEVVTEDIATGVVIGGCVGAAIAAAAVFWQGDRAYNKLIADKREAAMLSAGPAAPSAP